MSEHVTYEILQAAAARLTPAVVGLELSCGPVKALFVSRITPTDVRDLPAINLYIPDETIVRRRGRPGLRPQRRAIRMQVVASLPRPAGPDNSLELDIARLKTVVEETFGSDPTLSSGVPAEPLASDLYLTNAGSGLDPNAGLTVCLAWLTYSAVAHHREGDPTRPFTRAQLAQAS